MTISLAGHNFTLHPQMYVAKMDMADETTRAALGIEKGLMQRTDGEEEQAAEDEYAAAGTAAAGTPATQELGQQDEGLDPLQGFRKRMASLQAGRKTDASSSSAATDLSSQAVHEACVALFMDMDMVSSLPGKPFILGIPFLRAFVSEIRSDGADRRPRGGARRIELLLGVQCDRPRRAVDRRPLSHARCRHLRWSRCAPANHASHALLGASSLTSGFGATATSEAVHKTALQPSNDLAPTPAETKAAHLEAVGALSLGAGVSTQVLPSKTILLPQQGSVHEQHVHSSSSSKPFHAPRIKLAQLRVPGWVRAAHGEWKKSKQRKQQQKKERVRLYNGIGACRVHNQEQKRKDRALNWRTSRKRPPWGDRDLQSSFQFRFLWLLRRDASANPLTARITPSHVTRGSTGRRGHRRH